jgi:hypothetical protein
VKSVPQTDIEIEGERLINERAISEGESRHNTACDSMNWIQHGEETFSTTLTFNQIQVPAFHHSSECILMTRTKADRERETNRVTETERQRKAVRERYADRERASIVHLLNQ